MSGVAGSHRIDREYVKPTVERYVNDVLKG